MKYRFCGYWNRDPVNKIFIQQNSPEPKARVFIPMYEPLEVVKCKKCGKSYSRIKRTNLVKNFAIDE